MLILFLFVAKADAPAGDRSGSFEPNGGKIHNVDRGGCEPVVLIQGFASSYEQDWEASVVIPALGTAGFRMIAMDCRGHGRSGKPRRSHQYGLEMVNDVVRLLDHLRIQRARAVGYLMGGWIVSQLLARSRERLLSATLIGAGWNGEKPEALTSWILELAEGFANQDASPLFRGVTGSGRNGPEGERIAGHNATLFERNDLQVLGAATRSLPELNRLSGDNLRDTKLPALAIIGERDENRPVVRRMKAVLPGLEVIEINGASHGSSIRVSAVAFVGYLKRYRRR